jgi:hypothetical protein
VKIIKRKCKLPLCEIEFEPTHGSQLFCSKACWRKMKTIVRKAKYDSTKGFVKLLAKNDELLMNLYSKNQFNPDINTLITYGFDFTIARNFNDRSRPGITIFDCGGYYCEMENQSKSIKIKKHEQ